MMSYMVENDEANKDFFDRRDLTTISIIEEVSNPFESVSNLVSYRAWF